MKIDFIKEIDDPELLIFSIFILHFAIMIPISIFIFCLSFVLPNLNILLYCTISSCIIFFGFLWAWRKNHPNNVFSTKSILSKLFLYILITMILGIVVIFTIFSLDNPSIKALFLQMLMSDVFVAVYVILNNKRG